MQLQTKENIKTSLDIDGARQFKLKLTAKTFKILSNLYNDKIRAIIREISCNAQDAHIAAGKPEVPIEVWLPTNREPYFKVKDTGLGLLEEDMYEIYTNVGESTKEQSNDQTGALGLGTKSPLYYADAFTVESIKDGNKKIYTCFLQDGFPTILKLPTMDENGNEIDGEETDEPNGVTVIVPTNDISYFNESASEVYRPFETRPIINRQSEHYYDLEYNILERGDNWIQLESGQKTLIKYGSIEYPLNSEMLEDLEYDERQFISEGFVIDMPLGSLDIIPSREALSYDDRTVANLKFVLQQVVAEAKEKVVPLIEEAMKLPLLPAVQNVMEAFEQRKGTYSHKNFFKECVRKLLEENKPADTDFEGQRKTAMLSNWSYRGSYPYLQFKKNIVTYQNTYDNVRLKMVDTVATSTIFRGQFRLAYSSDPSLSIHKIRRLLRHFMTENKDVRLLAFENDMNLFPGLDPKYIFDVTSLNLPKAKGTNSADTPNRYSIMEKKAHDNASYNDLKDLFDSGEYYWIDYDEANLYPSTLYGRTNDIFDYHDSTISSTEEFFRIAVKTKLIKDKPLIVISKRENILVRAKTVRADGTNFFKEIHLQLARFAKTHIEYLKHFRNVMGKNSATSYFQTSNGSTLSVDATEKIMDVFGTSDQIEYKRLHVLKKAMENHQTKTEASRHYLKTGSKLNKDLLFSKLMSKVPVSVLVTLVGPIDDSIVKFIGTRSVDTDIVSVVKKDLVCEEILTLSSNYRNSEIYNIRRDVDHVSAKVKDLKFPLTGSSIPRLERKIMDESYNLSEKIIRLHILKKLLRKRNIIQ